VGAIVRGVALSVDEGKVGFEMVGLKVVCVVGEVTLVMRGCTLLAVFDTVYATLKVAIWGHVSGVMSTGPENTSESSRYQLPCVNLRATACRWFVSTRECTPALSRALDLSCNTLGCTVLISSVVFNSLSNKSSGSLLELSNLSLSLALK